MSSSLETSQIHERQVSAEQIQGGPDCRSLGHNALSALASSKVMRSILAVGLAFGAGTAVGTTLEMSESNPPAATAIGGERAAILMPFDNGGRTWISGEGPNDHHVFWNRWSTDLHSTPGTAVKPRVQTSDGNITMTVAGISNTCAAPNNAGKNVRVNISVDGIHAGQLLYGHLDNVRVAQGDSVNSNTELGNLKLWDQSSCWQDTLKDGLVHTHVEVAKGCYRDLAASTNFSGSTALGLLSSDYQNDNKNVCDEDDVTTVMQATPPPLTPYNQNVKFDSDSRSDLVVSRYAGGLVVASGAPGDTLVDTPSRISVTNWPIPKWAGTADFNGDGSTDVLVEWPSGFGVALGHPNGIFSEGGVTLAGRSSENWAGVGNFYKNDVDTTPRADFVVARPGGGFVVAYGMPNGTLADGPISLHDWTVQSWAGVGDFNGDGYSDILVAKPASAGGGFGLALGHPDGIFTFGGNELPGWTTGVWAATGNFAGDARHDLVVAKPGGGFAIAHPRENGTLLEGQESLFGWSVSSWAGTADIDGNGYTDILIARPEGGFAVALGNQNGIFTPGPVVALPGWGIQNWGGNGAFVNSKGYGYVRP